MKRPRLPRLGVQITGRQFLRFILAREDGTYWTGSGWSDNRSHALLYFHIELIREDLRKLKRNRRKPR